ncbi:MAG: glycoside hydrolase family 28 protein [Verrucomicrobia bacterium]|nr:glycoside hydrolase family 28 protein [Verrucomicrobiota bacterium]
MRIPALCPAVVFAAVCCAAISAAVQTGAFDICSFGAVPDGQTKSTEAIRKAIGAASERGGGTIHFPAGTFLTGPIHLVSNITLDLDAGAVVKFSTDFDDYLPMVPSRWEGVEVTNYSPLIYAQGASNIAIRGRGTLDGQGKAWWSFLGKVKRADKDAPKTKGQEEFRRLNPNAVSSTVNKGAVLDFLRPPFIQPRNCTNLLIEGVTIINSPFWTVSPLYCDNVTIHAVTIHNPESGPNTDGINPDSCRNVHISDCHISVGDDCITIKSGRDEDGRRVGRPCENITISNCTMADGHGGVVIGSEMSGGVRNITIANCIFDGTDRGIRLKSARGRGGVVEDVRVSNVIMRDIRREAVLITTFYTKSDPEPVSARTPVFRRIHFSGITGDAKVAGELTGLAEMPLEGITFNDVHLDATSGFTLTDTRDVGFHHVTVNTKKGPALVADKTAGLELNAFKTTQPHAKTPVVDLLDVKQVFLHGCVAAQGKVEFVHVSEKSASEVVLEGNSFKTAAQAVFSAKEGK